MNILANILGSTLIKLNESSRLIYQRSLMIIFIPLEVVSDIPAKIAGLKPGSSTSLYFLSIWQIKTADSIWARVFPIQVLDP